MAKVSKVKETLNRVIGINAGAEDAVRLKLIEMSLQTRGYADEDELKWLTKEAKAGNEEARAVYFTAVVEEAITDVDWRQLERWSLALMETDPATASLQLGTIYMTEESGLMDFHKAEKYYRKGVELGVPGFKLALGMLYCRELSGEHDISEVRELLEDGVKAAPTAAGYYHLAEVCQEMDDFETAIRVWKKYLKLVPDDGGVCLILGLLYQQGCGCRRDDKLALQYFQKAANTGEAEGMLHVGRAYQTGCGVRRNYKRANDYFERAVNAGNAEALSALGANYLVGNGVIVDAGRAFEFFRKAYEQGEMLGSILLAHCYRIGIGVKADVAQAEKILETLRENCEDEDMDSIMRMAECMMPAQHGESSSVAD